MRPSAMVLLLLFAAGCAEPEPIPTYPMMSARQSLATLESRSSSIHEITSTGTVTLTDTHGRSVHLDAALVLQPPGRARVRAWKFGQAVLDLTLRDDGIWLFLPRGDRRADEICAASRQTAAAIRQWLGSIAGDLRASRSETQFDGGQLIVSRSDESGTLRVKIDRRTLTARRYTFIDPSNTEQFGLTMDRYREIGSIVWPTRIEATSKTGKIIIDLRDIDLNNAPPNAFDPPKRAEKLQ